MKNRWVSAVAVLVLTCLGFFVFPGRSILQSDTQIYIPILERLADPTVLSKDIMATRPHVAFTLYDEVALLLRKVTGYSFEHVLTAQQFLYRAVGVLGLFLIATAAGLPLPLAWLVTAVVSLGASVMGPMVLLIEYEPVPRGFALPLVVFSLGAIAHGRRLLAAASAAVAVAFHPPTAFVYASLLGCLLLRRREWRGLSVLAAGAVVVLLSAITHPVSAENPPLFGRIDPSLEALQRMRANYNWVGVWIDRWLAFYLALWAVGVLAWWRVRSLLPNELSVFAVAMPIFGMLSVPVSYVLLDRMKWVLAPQFQPARYLLFVTLFAMLLACLAACHAVQKRSYAEAFAFFLAPLAATATEWDTANLTGVRLPFVAGLAAVLTLAAIWRRYTPVVVIAAIAPFFILPHWASVQPVSTPPTPELDDLSRWARGNTPAEALFQFAEATRGSEPGIFRARALRSIYVDWKGGGQVNFLPAFATEWSTRWALATRARSIEDFRKMGVEYIVFRTDKKPTGLTAVYENSRYAVYDVRKASTSARVGMDAWAPIRVTEMAAAAFANRSADSSSLPSVSATANAALKVSPAAVASRASTENPGE
jgi:hypothetical protein